LAINLDQNIIQGKKNTQIILLLSIGLICFLGGIYANEINAKSNNRKEVKMMKKAQVKVKNLSRAIESLEKFKNKDTNGFQRRLKNTNNSFDKKAEEILNLTGELSGGDAATIEDEVEEIQQRLAALNGSVEQEAGDKNASKELWKSHLASKEYKSDKAKLEEFKKLSPSVLDIKSRRFRTGTNSQIEDSLAVLSGLSSMMQDLQDMQEQYKQFGKDARFINSDISDSKDKVKSLDQQLETSISLGNKFLEDKDEQLHVEVEKVFTRQKQVESAGGTFSLDYSLMDKSQPVAEVLLSIKRISQFLEEATNHSGNAQELSDASFEYYDGVIDDVEELITANKKTPEDTYSGRDRKMLEEFVRDNYPSSK